MGCEQIGGGRSGPCKAHSRCGTGVSVGLMRDRDEGRVKGKAGVYGRRDTKMLGGKV